MLNSNKKEWSYSRSKPKFDGDGISESTVSSIPRGLFESLGKSGFVRVTPGDNLLRASNLCEPNQGQRGDFRTR